MKTSAAGSVEVVWTTKPCALDFAWLNNAAFTAAVMFRDHAVASCSAWVSSEPVVGTSCDTPLSDPLSVCSVTESLVSPYVVMHSQAELPLWRLCSRHLLCLDMLSSSSSLAQVFVCLGRLCDHISPAKVLSFTQVQRVCHKAAALRSRCCQPTQHLPTWTQHIGVKASSRCITAGNSTDPLVSYLSTVLLHSNRPSPGGGWASRARRHNLGQCCCAPAHECTNC